MAFFTDDWSARLAAAETTITKALSLAPNHALAHLVLGAVLIFTNRAAQGMAECEQALALDRNLAGAHALIGPPSFFLAEAQKPKLTSTRHSASLLATSWPTGGFCLSAAPRGSSMPMPKQSSGCVGASTQTEIILSRILFSRLAWRGSGSWMKRGLTCKRDLRSIQVSPSAAIVTLPVRGATIRRTVPDANASIEGMRLAGVPEG